MSWKVAIGNGKALMAMVTVFTAFNPMDAQVIRSRLEAGGLHPQVSHELSALSLEGYALTAGGILVQVPDEEAKDARELIAAHDPWPAWARGPVRHVR